MSANTYGSGGPVFFGNRHILFRDSLLTCWGLCSCSVCGWLAQDMMIVSSFCSHSGRTESGELQQGVLNFFRVIVRVADIALAVERIRQSQRPQGLLGCCGVRMLPPCCRRRSHRPSPPLTLSAHHPSRRISHIGLVAPCQLLAVVYRLSWKADPR